jgi:hypothetical protein
MPTPIEWPSIPIGSGTGSTYQSGNGNLWTWNGYAWEGEILDVIPTVGASYDKELISGGAVWSTGMTFDVSVLTYTFYGPLQTTNGATSVTLSNGDATYDRIDAIVVNDDDPYGIVSVIEGATSPNPVTPEIPNDQLLVQYVIVPAGTTTLSFNQDFIYNENVEWTGSVYDSGGLGTINFTATSPPPSVGTYCVGVTGNNRRRWVRFTRSSTILSTDYTSVSLRVYFPTSLPTPRRLYLRFRLGTSYIGNGVYVNPTFASGSLTGTWQNVVIPLYLFNLSGNIDGLDIQLTARNSTDIRDWAIDYIQLQNGLAPSLGQAPQNKPWAIYTQGTGIPIYYQTFSQANSAAQNGDVIHLYGDVTETVTSTITITKEINIHLNGHQVTFTNPTSIGGDVITIQSRNLSIFDGKIKCTLGITPPNGALINFDGNSTIYLNSVEIWNSSYGYAARSSEKTLILKGGIFRSEATTAFFNSLPAVGTSISDVICIGASHGYYTSNGDSYSIINMVGISNSIDDGRGIYLSSGGGRIQNSYGYASGATDSAAIWMSGKWNGNNLYSQYDGPVSGFYPSYSFYAFGASLKDSVIIGGGDEGTYSLYSTRSNFDSVEIESTSLIASSSTFLNTYFGGVVELSDSSLISGVNCYFNGGILGSTGADFQITKSTIRDGLYLGPSDGSDNSSIVDNVLTTVTGATSYFIYTNGATSRSVYMANNYVAGPTAGLFDPATVTQALGATIDSKGNILRS